MLLYVYDTSFDLIGIIELYSSLIWSDRYSDCGDFELEMMYQKEYMAMLQKDRYCSVDFSEHYSVIEKVEIKKEDESPVQLIVSGRSIESILQRRIIIGKTEFGEEGNEANLQNSVHELLNECVINPADEKRKIPNFIFQESADPEITKLTIVESFDGDNLYDAINGMCSDKHISYKIVVNSNKQLVFSLYATRDRSADVIFSPYYDNIRTSQYFSSTEDYHNVMIISKDEESFLTAFITVQEPTGLFRREAHEDISTFKENKQTELTDDQVRVKAAKALKDEHKIKTGFEADIIPEVMYLYRKDYNVGDKVMLEDAYGNSKIVYISEVVITFDENGLSILPTFEEIDWIEN